MNIISQCDYVFADLSDFRRIENYPMCVSGTAVGGGNAMGLNKKVIGLLIQIDPEFSGVQDCNVITAFKLGRMCELCIECKVIISDKRNQVEKYGKTDKNRESVENFDYPVNIMIQLNCEII